MAKMLHSVPFSSPCRSCMYLKMGQISSNRSQYEDGIFGKPEFGPKTGLNWKKAHNSGPLLSSLQTLYGFQKFQKQLHTCQYLLGTPVKHFNAIDTWGPLKVAKTAKKEVEMAKRSPYKPYIDDVKSKNS